MWGQQYGGGFGWQQQQQQWPGMPQQNPTPQSTDPVEWAEKAAQWAQQRQVQEQSYYQQAMLDQQQALQQAHVYHQQHEQYNMQHQTFTHDQVWPQQTQETVLPPKPLFDTPISQPAPVHQLHGIGGTPSNNPSFHNSPHIGVGSEEVGGQEFRHQSFPQPRGSREGGFGTRGGEFGPRGRGDRFRSPRGRGGAPRPRFAPRGSPHGSPSFRPHVEESRSPHGKHTAPSVHHGGPTAEHFDRRLVTAEGVEETSQESFSKFGAALTQDSSSLGEKFAKQLEAAKQEELEHERKMKRERMQEIERQRKIEMEKKLEREAAERREREQKEREEQRKRKEEEETAAAERAKQREIERKRLQEEVAAKQEAEELEKKRQLDFQLAQEIENKKREMERILEQKERMERELMEKRAKLGRMGGEGWGSDDYQSEQGFAGQEDAPNRHTIPSWSGNPNAIPGLGEIETQGQANQTREGAEGNQPQDNYTQSQGQTNTGATEDTSQMVESLGKIVSQLQTLQGLTSSLKLLKTMPKEGGGAGEGVRVVSERERAAMREKELSEDTKRKVAALLANESDSDGEKESSPRRSRRDAESTTAAAAAAAREFDGTYNIQPQVYGTYQADDYDDNHRDDPPDLYKRDQDLPPGGSRYSRYDYDDMRSSEGRDGREGREGRSGYGGFPPHEEGAREREGERRYPPRPYPPRPPPDEDLGYPPPREYPSYPGGRWAREDDERRRPLSPRLARGPSHDYAYERPRYLDPEPPAPSVIRGRPHPDDYRGPPPPQIDPYYSRPPSLPEAEPKRAGGGILSQMESIDYSHGGSLPGMKSVDYGHGTPGGTGGYLSAPLRENPPLRTNLPSFGGPRSEYAGIYGESGSFMGFGSPAVGAGVMGGGGMYMGTPVGLDPAAIFAAYQGGEAKRRTLPLWLREELEKLERKKAKQLEKEAREGADLGEGGRPKWAEELERESERGGEVGRDVEGEGRWVREEEEEEEEETKMATEKIRIYRQRSSRSPILSGDEGSPPQKKRHYEPPPESDEDKHLNLVMKIRHMLTEVLLEVTNQEIESVVTETMEEAKKPKLVIQMKGVAANVQPSKENRQILGLGAYSSGSESDSGDSPDSKSRSSKRKTKPTKAKIPNPEEIAAAFGGGSFLPVPRSVQERQRESEKTTSSGSTSKEKERDKKEKKSKEKHTPYDSGNDSGSRDHSKRERKKSSEKDRDRDSSGSSHKKSSSSRSKDQDRDKEKKRERSGKEHSSGSSRDSKHSPASSKSRKSRWNSSSDDTPTLTPGAKTRSSRPRAHSPSPPRLPTSPVMRPRSRSPPHFHQSPPMQRRVIEVVPSARLGGVSTGKGSLRTTRGGFVSTFTEGCPPIGNLELRRSPSPVGRMRSDDPPYRSYGRRNSSHSSHY